MTDLMSSAVFGRLPKAGAAVAALYIVVIGIFVSQPFRDTASNFARIVLAVASPVLEAMFQSPLEHIRIMANAKGFVGLLELFWRDLCENMVAPAIPFRADLLPSFDPIANASAPLQPQRNFEAGSDMHMPPTSGSAEASLLSGGADLAADFFTQQIAGLVAAPLLFLFFTIFFSLELVLGILRFNQQRVAGGENDETMRNRKHLFSLRTIAALPMRWLFLLADFFLVSIAVDLAFRLWKGGYQIWVNFDEEAALSASKVKSVNLVRAEHFVSEYFGFFLREDWRKFRESSSFSAGVLALVFLLAVFQRFEVFRSGQRLPTYLLPFTTYVVALRVQLFIAMLFFGVCLVTEASLVVHVSGIIAAFAATMIGRLILRGI